MRLAAVIHRGYGELIMQRSGPFWGWLSVLDVVFTKFVTVITEIVASGWEEILWHPDVGRRRARRACSTTTLRSWVPTGTPVSRTDSTS